MNPDLDPSDRREARAADGDVVELGYGTQGDAARRHRMNRAVWMGIAIPFACMGLWGMVHSTRRSCPSPRTECAANLRSIGMAMYIYAVDEPDEMFPDNMQRVLDALTALPKQFTCPSAAAGHQCYYYVPGYSTKSDPGAVVMFEDPRNHGGKGGHVLYQDGHVVFEKTAVLQSIVNANKAKAQ